MRPVLSLALAALGLKRARRDAAAAHTQIGGLRALLGQARADVERVQLIPGPMGPMPRHQISGHCIRFEIEPGKWGAWINLAHYNFNGSGGVSEARVFELMGGAGDSATAITVEYVSASDHRPARVVRDDNEDRFDWGTGAADTFQYKGTAPVGTATSAPQWAVIRTTLDALARPTIRNRLEGQIYDDRVTLLWP